MIIKAHKFLAGLRYVDKRAPSIENNNNGKATPEKGRKGNISSLVTAVQRHVDALQDRRHKIDAQNGNFFQTKKGI
jgi:hypothetical protein